MNEKILGKLRELNLSEDELAKALKLYEEKYGEKFVEKVVHFDIAGAAAILNEFIDEVIDLTDKEEEKVCPVCGKVECECERAAEEDELFEEDEDDEESDDCPYEVKCLDEEDCRLPECLESGEEDREAEGSEYDSLWDALNFAAFKEVSSNVGCEAVGELIKKVDNMLSAYIDNPTETDNVAYSAKEHAISIVVDEELTHQEANVIKLYFGASGMDVDVFPNDLLGTTILLYL